MCSLDYLSKKSILLEEIRKSQLELIELKKEYQTIFNDEILSEHLKSSNDLNEKSKNVAKARNKQILDDFERHKRHLHQIVNNDDNRLRELREAYIASVRKDEVDSHLLAPVITPRLRESRERMSTPSPSLYEHQNQDIPEINIYSGEDNTNNGEIENTASLLSPMITPRIADHRDRMRSPSKPLSHFSDDDSDEEQFINDENNDNDCVDRLLRLMEVLNARSNTHGKVAYLRPCTISLGQEEAVKKALMESRSIQTLPGSDMLVAVLLRWIPVACIYTGIDISATLSQTFPAGNISQEQMTSLVRSAMCRDEGQEKLWKGLEVHLMSMARRGDFSAAEIAGVFAPLLMPLSATDSNEEQVVALITSWLAKSITKASPPPPSTEKSKPTIRSTAADSFLLSDDETVTVSSSIASDPAGRINKQKGSMSYGDLRRSLAEVAFPIAKGTVTDDDPNEDLNSLFAGPAAAPAQSPSDKQRLADSIRNIDDDLLPGGVPPVLRVDRSRHDDDDDFDFYK